MVKDLYRYIWKVSARDQVIPFPLPALLGHEGAGIVDKFIRQVP